MQVRYLNKDGRDIQIVLVQQSSLSGDVHPEILHKQKGGSGETIRRVWRLHYNPRTSYLVDQSGYGSVVPRDIRIVLKLLCEMVRFHLCVKLQCEQATSKCTTVVRQPMSAIINPRCISTTTDKPMVEMQVGIITGELFTSQQVFTFAGCLTNIYQ